MSATDEKPTRLEAAKERVDTLIKQMKLHDEAMIISFSDVARVEQGFSDNPQPAPPQARADQADQPPDRPQRGLAAPSGLANPGR